MMGAWQIDPTNTRAWTDEERESAKRAAAVYKQWIRPLLGDVKVRHVLPRPDGVHWDGLFYWSPSGRRGTLYVFRPAASEEEQTVKLKGLDSLKRYRLWSEDGSVAPGVRTGAELTGRGLAIRLPERYTSDLIYVQEASLPPPKGLTAPGKFHLRPPRTGGEAFGASAKSKDLSGIVFVSDLPWARATAGAGNPVRRDTNYYGRPICVGGHECPKGVWTHAFNDATPADVVVDVSQLGVAFFAAEAGVENEGGNGTVQFQVLADEILRAESPVLKQGEAHRFRVDVAGAKQVTLRVLNGGDGHTCDHAAWGLARFIKTAATDPLAPSNLPVGRRAD
jgi:hypothetical protein